MKLVDIKTATITEKGQIAIPKDLRNIEGFKVGLKVAILAFKDRVELRPLRKINPSMLTALASERVLSKDWDSKEEDIAWKNL